MKKVFCATLSICFFASLWAATDLHFQWTVEASAPLPYHAEAMQGETFTLSATLHQYGQALSGPATATFYYQTTEMSQTQWYSAPATWESATGKASIKWSSALDVGHTKYRFFFGIETSQGKNYRAFGTLRLKPSPGFSPATLAPTDVRELFKQEILAEVLQHLESTFAPTEHTHPISAIDGLQSALEGKADASHTHADLQQSATVLLQAINSESESREEADAALQESIDTVSTALDEAIYHDKTFETTTADDINGMSCQKAKLSEVGFQGPAVKISEIHLFHRSGASTNGTIPLWLRFLRHDGTGWYVAYQATEPITLDAPNTTNGRHIVHLMEHHAGSEYIPTDEPVIICYAGSKEAAADAFIPFSAKLANATKNLIFSGNALPSVNATDGWARQLAFYVKYKYRASFVEDLTPYLKKSEVDSSFSYTSTNPVQNKVVYSALQDRMTWSDMYGALSSRLESGDSPYSNEFDALFGGYNAFRELPATLTVSSPNQGGVLGFTEINGTGYIAWKSDMDGQRRKYALGGGNTEVWTGNVGFGEQDTFIGAKKTADGDGQFQNGYPRLHNHGQDIHEVSGFSRDSRDDETVWSHRLLLPWDLAKANDTSYLMAGVVWNGSRNLVMNGDTATFVQPLLPENTGSTKSALPYAIPCFENSPVFWKGTIIWNDGTQVLSKAVQIPWDRVTGTTASPTELALKRDVDGKQDKLTAGENITIKNGVISATGGEAQARSSHVLAWQANTSLLTVTPDEADEVGFSAADWPEGATLLVRLTTPEAFELPSTVRLVGYFDLEGGATYQLTAYVMGGVLHLVPILREETL